MPMRSRCGARRWGTAAPGRRVGVSRPGPAGEPWVACGSGAWFMSKSGLGAARCGMGPTPDQGPFALCLPGASTGSAERNWTLRGAGRAWCCVGRYCERRGVSPPPAGAPPERAAARPARGAPAPGGRRARSCAMVVDHGQARARMGAPCLRRRAAAPRGLRGRGSPAWARGCGPARRRARRRPRWRPAGAGHAVGLRRRWVSANMARQLGLGGGKVGLEIALKKRR